MPLPHRILSLSDSALEQVMAAAHPLAPDQRGPFLEALAGRLSGVGEIGDGAVHRAIRELQRDYFDPPIERGAQHHGNYRRRPRAVA
jgi:hypothetical protein